MRALRSALVTIAILLGLGFGLATAQQGQAIPGLPSRRPSKRRLSTPSPAAPARPSRHRPRPQLSRTSWRCSLTAGWRCPVPRPTARPSQRSTRSATTRSTGRRPVAFPLPLTEEQRQRIRAAVSEIPVQSANTRPADLLPSSISIREFADQITTEIPAMRISGTCAPQIEFLPDQPGEPHRRRRSSRSTAEVNIAVAARTSYVAPRRSAT